jgi:hypothetical protein
MASLAVKITVIVIYLLLLTFLYLSIYFRYGNVTESTVKESFNNVKKLKSTVNNFHTYGTLLRNIPIVNDVAKKFASVKPQKFKDAEGYKLDMPKEFNGIEVWKNFLSPITEQGKCGNCWAHASTCVLADRFAILSLGQVRFIPSPYDITICGAYQFSNIEQQWGNVTELQKMDDYFQGRKVDPNNELQSAACEGAALYTAANILYTEGVTDITCFPSKGAPKRDASYDVNQTSSGSSSDLPYCYKLQTLDFDTCVDQKTAMKKYRAKTAYNVGDPEHDTLDDLEQAIMHEIYRNGPVVSGFVVYDDFMDPTQYDGKTIYQHKNKNASSDGGHAVRIVGWGEEIVNNELIPFWWIANSWGKSWGLDGYFKFKRKMVECQLELNVMAMLPDFPGMTITDTSIIPIESKDEITTRNFTKHYLDPTCGFYTSAMDKVKQCKLQGNISLYADPNYTYPDYSTFFAAEIGKYTITSPSNLPQLVTCVAPPPGVTPSPSPSTPSPVPSSSTTPVPSPTPTLVTSKKLCFTELSNDKYSPFVDKIASNKYAFNSSFAVCAVGGVCLIWKLLSDDAPALKSPSILSTNSTSLSSSSPLITPMLIQPMSVPSISK